MLTQGCWFSDGEGVAAQIRRSTLASVGIIILKLLNGQIYLTAGKQTTQQNNCTKIRWSARSICKRIQATPCTCILNCCQWYSFIPFYWVRRVVFFLQFSNKCLRMVVHTHDKFSRKIEKMDGKALLLPSLVAGRLKIKPNVCHSSTQNRKLHLHNIHSNRFRWNDYGPIYLANNIQLDINNNYSGLCPIRVAYDIFIDAERCESIHIGMIFTQIEAEFSEYVWQPHEKRGIKCETSGQYESKIRTYEMMAVTLSLNGEKPQNYQCRMRALIRCGQIAPNYYTLHMATAMTATKAPVSVVPG